MNDQHFLEMIDLVEANRYETELIPTKTQFSYELCGKIHSIRM